MKVLFIIIALIGLSYFLFSKRTFDFFSVAFFSAIIYFIPGFYGYAILPGFYKSYLIHETYMVMMLVLIGILISGIFNDFRNDRKINDKTLHINGSYNMIFIITVITIISFIMMIITVGGYLFSPSKVEMLQHSNRWVILWTNSTSFGFVLSILMKRKRLSIFFVIMLLFNLYMGHRSTLAISLIAVFTNYLNMQKRQRFFINNIKFNILVIFTGFFFFAYKQVHAVLKLGYWNIVWDRITDLQFYLYSISYSEPFITQVILNEILKTKFYVGMEHFKSIMYQFILFAPTLGAENISFNTLFQPTLFPEEKYGMASNIWAEMWSAGGWSLLVIFVVFFVTVIFYANKLLENKDPIIRSVVLLMTTYWVFYIHRNTINYQINLEKRVFLIWAFSIFISIITTSNIHTKKFSILHSKSIEKDNL
jgi:hypothetical protein